MMHAFEEGQRVYSAREKLFGVLTSGPRLRLSDFRVGLTPPCDPNAIPSYDVKFDNDAIGTVPANELIPQLRLDPEPVAGQSRVDRWAPLREKAGKNWMPLALLIGLGAALPFVDRLAWAEKNNVTLTLLFGSVAAVATVAGLFRR